MTAALQGSSTYVHQPRVEIRLQVLEIERKGEDRLVVRILQTNKCTT